MTDAERQQVFQNTEFDLMAIKQSGNYLLSKFNKLSDRDKEDVLDYLNMKLSRNSRRNSNVSETPEKTFKDNVVTVDFGNRKLQEKGASV